MEDVRSRQQRRPEEHSSAAFQVPDEPKEHSDDWLARRGKKMVLVIVFYVVLCSGVFIWFQIGRQPPKLLIISVAGLRWDYLSQIPSKDAPFFTHFLRFGSRAEWLNPTFPGGGTATQTSVYTGLYPERHGIFGDHFMDRQLGELHIEGPAGHSADDPAWWAGVIPIWNSAVKQWRITSVINVHGGCVPFDGYEPNYCQTPNKSGEKDDFSENLARGLGQLLNDDYNMAIVHTDLLKNVAEHQGANSKRVLEEVITLDHLLQAMDDHLVGQDLRDKINIVIFSDGGLTDTEHMEVVNIHQYLPPDVPVTVIGNGPTCYVYTDEKHVGVLFGALNNVPGSKVYKRPDIPSRYRMGHPSRAPDIFVVAEKNTFIENTVPLAVAAVGGYDDTEGDVPDMRGVFLARGPSFKHSVVLSPIHATDAYSLIASVIDVTPEIHSGNHAHTAEMVNW